MRESLVHEGSMTERDSETVRLLHIHCIIRVRVAWIRWSIR